MRERYRQIAIAAYQENLIMHMLNGTYACVLYLAIDWNIIGDGSM